MKMKIVKLEEFENDIIKVIYLVDKETMGKAYCEAHIIWKNKKE